MRLLNWKPLVLITAALIAIAQTRADVLIGDASPLTGPVSWYGGQALVGTDLAVADLNAEGGVLEEQVRLISVDDAW